MCVRSAACPRHCLLLAGILWGGVASAADVPASNAAQAARFFLLRYIGLTWTADVAALDMYRDDARARVATMVDGRETQAGIVEGKKWKEQLRAGWFDGTTKLEASSFQHATVSRDGSRLLIRAQRYSQARCNWDSSYAVAIEPNRVGQFQIVEERITFQRGAFCSSGTRQTTPQLTGSALLVAAGDATAATTVTASARRAGAPPNIVPSGKGVPRLPAPIGAAPNPALARPTAPARLGASFVQHP